MAAFLLMPSNQSDMKPIATPSNLSRRGRRETKLQMLDNLLVNRISLTPRLCKEGGGGGWGREGEGGGGWGRVGREGEGGGGWGGWGGWGSKDH